MADKVEAVEVREKAAPKSCCCCSCCVCKFQDHRTPEEQEIVELFLAKRRYGLPDSDGSELSNYLRFIGNHDCWPFCSHTATTCLAA